MAGSGGAGTDVFCLVSSDRPHGKSMKLAEIRFDWGQGAVWSQVLDLIILVGPFQLKVFCDRFLTAFFTSRRGVPYSVLCASLEHQPQQFCSLAKSSERSIPGSHLVTMRASWGPFCGLEWPPWQPFCEVPCLPWRPSCPG